MSKPAPGFGCLPWVCVLGYFIGVGLQWLLSVPAMSPTTQGAPTFAGAAFFVAGAAVAGWSLLIFARSKITTVPGMLSRILVAEGPYRFTRNPMYVGLALAYLGEVGLGHQLGPLLLLPFVLAYVHWAVLPIEEEALDQEFGAPNQRYRSRVRRWV